MQDFLSFLAPVHFLDTQLPELYNPQQWGHIIYQNRQSPSGYEEADLVILGCGEMRSADPDALYSDTPDAVRAAFYKQFCWHPDIRIYDLGNLIEGRTLDDTRASLRLVLHELYRQGKMVLVLGGTHDLMLQQYEVYKLESITANVVVADMRIDLDEDPDVSPHTFLYELLTGQPNYVRHYSHLGFQSFATHPHTLETLDKLRFDFFRLGWLRESIEEAEPVLRQADLFGFDMTAVRFGDAPANTGGSPNGFSGEEACALARYAGMSERLESFGIYGWEAARDRMGMTAQLAAQMIWYFIDGLSLRKTEAELSNRAQFAEFPVVMNEHHSLFLKSRRTGRWWMQIPNQKFIPCSYTDYKTALSDQLPERWLREQERLV
jgi:arginase family enzyme